jgi:hypothetical protein
LNRLLQRYVASVLAFGFVAVSLTAGIGSALLCLLAAGVAYGATSFRYRRRVDRFTADFMADARKRREHAPSGRRRGGRVPAAADADDGLLLAIHD